jgi:hypothetical protein
MKKFAGGARDSIGLMWVLILFAVMCAYLLYVGYARHIVLAVGVTMVLYSASGGDLIGSLLTGSILTLVVIRLLRHGVKKEGFQDAPEEEQEEEEVVAKQEEAPKPATKKKKMPLPDNGDRAEMFELGKKYKMPVSESEDGEYHMDAGTTFMNAYKSLKPEQIAAMTKDTQELIDTQKQLMSTLHTLKPLISDGKQMMEMFQSYFGSSNPTLN